MNQRERLTAVCRDEPVDYVPIIGLPGASGVAFGGAWGQVYRRLVETGMPPNVTGWTEANAFDPEAPAAWSAYWGTVTPVTVTLWPTDLCPSVAWQRRSARGREIIEYETGAVTEQVIDNDDRYSMPHFHRYHVRDWDSWRFYRTRMTPGPRWPHDRLVEACRRYEPYRDRPLAINLLSTWGALRDLMGPEAACTVLYDDPELAHDIIAWQRWLRQEYLFPLVEHLRPDILLMHEDCCYNHGMLLSPTHFDTFCGPSYREVGQLKQDCGAALLAVDSDGAVRELVDRLVPHGVNAVYPTEAKGNPDLLQWRDRYPELIVMGALEKEVCNEGNEALLEREVQDKAAALLGRGRYLPNLDHTLQPLCTFRHVCRFMTLLHDLLGNPEGCFPRVAEPLSAAVCNPARFTPSGRSWRCPP